LKLKLNRFGAGFISTVGAMNLATNKPFTFTCTNKMGNIKIQTNYMLTATNNPVGNMNYLRTLDMVTDNGPWGTGNTVGPYPNPPATFAVGQSMCVNNAPVSFAFPASGGVLPTGAPSKLFLQSFVSLQ
jgi:hypothetical protein